VDEAVCVAREEFIPVAQQSGGFEGLYILADLESGKALSLALRWPAEKLCWPAKSKRIILGRKLRTTREEE
jgi:hypothetical protein